MGVHEPAVWIGFSVLVVGLLVLDLGVLNRKSHVLSFREALSWSTGLVTLALLFGVFLWVREGTQTALEYYTGYIIELSLSVDNLFVFLLIFQYFAVPAELRFCVKYCVSAASAAKRVWRFEPVSGSVGRHCL